ncbi:MAG TPA: DUF4349 domain-containing protein [Solirubrobacterales bacterium]|nr:DUF4349 domain-containing protein [Solirubrobacterales bacterium]
MEPPRDDQLIADLRALRPTPRPEFAAELDQCAAAGFPRRSRLSLKSPPDFWTAMRNKGPAHPRRLLLAGGGAVLAAIAVTTVLVASNEPSHSRHVIAQAVEHAPPKSSGTPQNFDGAGHYNSPSQPSAAGGPEASGVQYEAEAPVIPSASSAASSESAEAVNGSFRHRDVERSAEIILGAEPHDVAGDAAKVFAAVHANDGIVMRSSTRQGKAGAAGATFELLIPSAKLPDALAAFSEIDTVRSRHEATADITAPTVSAAELLQESRARIDSLLAQLEAAEVESEREAVEAELHHERHHAARLAAQLDHLHKRADYSRVSLRIVTGEAEESTGGGAWGIGDAFHDAGHILAIAAAITVVALAILGPIALIALLAWLTHRAWVRRERRRVLH